MSTLCWTVFHHAAAPAARAVAYVAHVARHVFGPLAHRAVRLPHHWATVAGQPHTWVEVVCKIVPAAIVGGGLLAPHPASPPRLPAPPPPIAGQAPPAMPWLFPPAPIPTTPVQPFPTPLPVQPPPATGPGSTAPAPPPIEAILEPSSIALLLDGAVCLLAIRRVTRRGRGSQRIDPGGDTVAST